MRSIQIQPGGKSIGCLRALSNLRKTHLQRATPSSHPIKTSMQMGTVVFQQHLGDQMERVARARRCRNPRNSPYPLG